MKLTRRSVGVCLALTLLLGSTSTLAAKKVRVRIGTVAPRDSLWHETLKRIRQEWQQISGGAIQVTIYAGGTLGDGPELVRKVRAGTLQGVGLSSVGMSRIDMGVSALQVPFMLSSYEELGYVRDRIAPRLERRMEEKGFKVLNWADAGWVYTFATEPITTPTQLRKMKIFTSAGDPETEKLYRELGFQVVPLSLTDLVTALQTGIINAFNLPPLFTLMLQQAFKLADNMVPVRWPPLVAGTVITTKTWEKIPERYRTQLLEAARKAGEEQRGPLRRMETDAIEEIKRRGLKVVELNAEAQAQWQTEAEEAFPRLRDRYAPADLFDLVQKLRDEYRSSRKPQTVQN